jgi:glycosyltransferase involved in cell wall biosynthesis
MAALKPKLTILVCTQNGSRTIGRCLESCLRSAKGHAPGEVEIVVVDNGSTDDTRGIAAAVLASSPAPFQILSASAPGKINAFLKGVRESAADLITLVDDDNLIDHAFTGHAVEFFDDYPDVGVTGSANVLHSDIQPPEWFPLAKQFYACCDPLIAEHVQNDARGRRTGALGYIAGAGMSFRRAPLLAELDSGYVFFNDTRRGVIVTGEDIELCMLFRSMGYRFGFDPRMRLMHALIEERLTKMAFWQLCQKVGAGSLGTDPFIFIAATTGPLGRIKRTWQWQLLSKLRQYVRLHLRQFMHGPTFTTQRELNIRWGAIRRIIKERSRYTRHIWTIDRRYRQRPNVGARLTSVTAKNDGS